LTATPGFLDNGRMGSQLAGLTWHCMVCGDERPDEAISVYHLPIPGMEDQFPGTRTNVRYCNDRPNCTARAVHYNDPEEQAERRRIADQQRMAATKREERKSLWHRLFGPSR